MSLRLYLISGLMTLVILGCENPDEQSWYVEPIKPVDNFYHFVRNGKSTVVNTGQICRNLIIQDFEIVVRGLAMEGASPIPHQELYKYYDNNGQTIDGPTLTEVDMPLVYETIKEISAIRDLKGRLYGPFANQNKYWMPIWIEKIVANSNDPEKLGSYEVYIDEETGHDLLQMFKVTAIGGVMFQHGIDVYFKDVEFDNNDTIVSFPGVTWLQYTWMEHHLDEAFGYYGAARKFHDFTDAEVVGYGEGTNYKDNVDVDGKIDFKTEYNFLFARLAAQRDLDSYSGTDFSRGVFDGFYNARVAIVEKDIIRLVQEKVVILDNWEKVITSTAIHHLNAVMQEMVKLQQSQDHSPELFYKHWSAMYKYTEMVRYNNDHKLREYKSILETKYVTDEVPFPKAIVDDVSKIDAYKSGLLEVRELIKQTYDFNEIDVKVW